MKTSQTTHTPGPWTARDDIYSDYAVVLDSRGFSIVSADHMPILENYAEKLGIDHWSEKPGEAFLELSPEEQKANARLIAAAPELLAAVEAVLEDENLCRNDWPEETMAVLQKCLNVYAALSNLKGGGK